MKNKAEHHQPSRIEPTPSEAEPVLGQRGKEIQPYGTLVHYPIDLSDEAKTESVAALNQLLSDTMALRDTYKKHHWRTR
jgi:starvation-inducible DNA-binding protein